MCVICNIFLKYMETKCASEMKNYVKFKVKKNAKLLCKLLMITFDDSANENKIEHNPKWPYIPDHPYRILIHKRESTGLKPFNDPKAFIEYSNDIQDVYKNIDEYNIHKERKILIVFDMIADIIDNKKLNSIVTQLFIRGRKLNISLISITQSYFKVPKDVRLNTTHFFIMKITNKRELQQIARSHSSDISSKDFINIYRAVP